MTGAALQHVAEPYAAVSPAAVLPVSQRVLTGHSGAGIVLYNSGLNSFVRKTSATPATNARLQSQAEKQRALQMLGIPFPRVFMQGTDSSGHATFDMEYLPGRSVADAIVSAASFDMDMVVTAIDRAIRLFDLSKGPPIAVDLFYDKIEAVIHSIADTWDEKTAASVESCASELKQRDWSGIPQSPCHGDLTLENILLTAGKTVAFIDCDVPFASSFWLDFGKLFQDIDGHWCIRALYADGASDVSRLNAAQKLDRLGTKFRALSLTFDPQLPVRLPQLAALGLLRAIPYAQSANLVAFLCTRIAKVLEMRP